MDQGPLVTEEINAGAKLAIDFDREMPLQAAFWLKRDGNWHMYLVSDQINDSNVYETYGLVIRVLGPGAHQWLDAPQVKVAGVDNRIAKDIIEMQQRYPIPFPRRLRAQLLGGVYVDEAWVYPIPVPVPA